MLEKFFHLAERGTTVRTKVTAGVTTFMTMAYILAVNPIILSACGMDAPSVFAATAISAALATCIMAFHANLPVALAPGMGLNAFFAYTVVLGMGHMAICPHRPRSSGDHFRRPPPSFPCSSLFLLCR